MDNYLLESVWPSPSASVRDEVVRFWVDENAMTEGAAIERASQLLVVARDHDDNVAAVSTVVPRHITSLGFTCFYFRSFVGRYHRVRGLRPTGLLQKLIARSYDVLNQAFREGIDQKVLGLYFEIESKSLLRHRRDLVWNEQGANIVYVGQLSGERQARVWYFSGSRLPR